MQYNPNTILDAFGHEVLKIPWKWVETVSLGVFGVADHEYDIRFPPRLGIRTRKVEKSVKFL
jgi:hypothetical protein